MSLRRTDARFLLPEPAGSATRSRDGWEELGQLGVQVVGCGGQLAVSGAGELDAALADRPPSVIVEGGAPRRRLRSAGYSEQRYLALPSLDAPDFLLPLGQPHTARYLLNDWIAPATRLKRRRNRIVAPVIGRGAVPPRSPTLTVASQRPGVPFLLRDAQPYGVPPHAQWFLVPAQGDVLSRGAFVVFAPGRREPTWIIKHARVPGRTEPFDRDERGLGLAARAGGVVARHSPRLLARFESAGIEASLESAGLGARLIGLLTSAASRMTKLAAVDRLAEWTLETAATTAASAGMLRPELERLGSAVLPRWPGADPRLLDRLGGVPAVLQHNDLGTWNIVVAADGGFTVLDWESVQENALPLWDLTYFLADALAHVDGASPLGARQDHFRRLFRGELETSAVLFGWIARTVARCGIPPEAVGAIVTLGWLHHGLSGAARVTASAAHRLEGPPAPWFEHFRRMGETWLADPQLGADWDRWRAP